MAARKLQLEIDRTLKKVSEGVDIFNEIYDKMNATAHMAQKEKLEADLKTQIKKLQRLRDQIKTWLTSNEIKDKSALADNRKLIETQMERFKACEKEMKTKAFSKEGLSAQAKLDPREQLKMETSNWVGNMVDELGRQIESAEAELETLAGSAKKKSATKGGRTSDLETLNERRKWHINRLELILRLMENGNLDPESVQDCKENISYFVESNTEEDFEEDEGLYDELNLSEEEEQFGLANADDLQSSHDSHSIADTSDIVTNATPSKPALRAATSASKDKDDVSTGEKSPTGTRASAGPLAKEQPTANNRRKSTLDGASRPPNLAQSIPPVPKVPTPSAPAPKAAAPVLPPIRYSAAAAAAVAPPPPPPVAPQVQPSAPEKQSAPSRQPSVLAEAPIEEPQKPVASPAIETNPSLAKASAPIASAVSIVPPVQNSAPTVKSPEKQASVPLPATTSAAPQAAVVTPLRPPSAQQSVVSPGSSAPGLPSALATAAAPLPPSQPQPATTALQLSNSEAARLPNSLSDLVTSFESAKQKSQKRDVDLSQVGKVLDSGFSNVPQPADADKPKYYVPKQPYSTPFYYPQHPYTALESPQLLTKFDNETLFYIFYYQVGTFLQYLAAEELKKRAWRFHKQYLTWFQRANEPVTITEEFEQGVYLYFDWETAWSTRKKNSFTFQYCYLEDGE